MQDIYERKAQFVKKLQALYINDCGNPEGIKRLDYVRDEDTGNEFVYISFDSFSQKRIFVNGSNEQGILLDFCNCIDHFNHYFWLKPNEPAFRAEFMEDEKWLK